MPYLDTTVLDAALSAIRAGVTAIHLCSAEPATYTAATSTNTLGNKTFAANGAFGAPGARSPNGRKITSTPINDGAVTANGTGVAWAAVGGTTLYAANLLASSQPVTSGNQFTLPAFDVGMPAAVSA